MKTIGQRARRTIARICVAASFAILLAAVAFPALRHHLIGGGWLTVISATVSILGGLAYLSTRRGAR